MPTISVVVNKEVAFRGKPEVFFNRYLFQTGETPINHELVWNVYEHLRDLERQFHSSRVKFVGGWGGILNEDALMTHTPATPPVGLKTDDAHVHPEVCAMAESKVRNRVYLRKFYHTCTEAATTEGDIVPTQWRSNMNQFLLKLTDGTMPGGVKACRPNGALATVPFTVDNHYRTRQFKRRGKRPTQGSG